MFRPVREHVAVIGVLVVIDRERLPRVLLVLIKASSIRDTVGPGRRFVTVVSIEVRLRLASPSTSQASRADL
jgi:hypothetical protein